MVAQTVVDPLRFSASDVTGMRRLDFDAIDGYRRAGEVASSIASLMELPGDAHYSLRDDVRARMLVDDDPIGEQVGREEADTRLVVIPKAHLG